MDNRNYEFSYDYSLKRNTIFLTGEINDDVATLVINQLLYLEDKDVEEIVIMINSPGGSVSSGLAIYDCMNQVKPRIVTIGIGMCKSMGALLLSSGSRGYRYAMQHCEVMIHQPLGGVSGQAIDIAREAKHIMDVKDELNEILSINTGKPKEVINQDTDRDYTMSARDACIYGLIDKVLEPKIKARG